MGSTWSGERERERDPCLQCRASKSVQCVKAYCALMLAMSPGASRATKCRVEIYKYLICDFYFSLSISPDNYFSRTFRFIERQFVKVTLHEGEKSHRDSFIVWNFEWIGSPHLWKRNFRMKARRCRVVNGTETLAWKSVACTLFTRDSA